MSTNPQRARIRAGAASAPVVASAVVAGNSIRTARAVRRVRCSTADRAARGRRLVRKLDPRHQVAQSRDVRRRGRQRPHDGLFVQALGGTARRPPGFILAISLWLWFTVLFANFAEAMAEGRGKAQADTLRKARKDIQAKQLAERRRDAAPTPVARRRSSARATSSSSRRATHPRRRRDRRRASRRSTRAPSPARARPSSARAAATAAPSRAARACCPTGSSSASRPNPGETFLDRMIAMVEGAKRQKTPNEIALDILLAALTIIFLLATVTLLPFSLFSVKAAGKRGARHDHRCSSRSSSA